MSAFFDLRFLSVSVECLESRSVLFLDISISIGVELRHPPGATRYEVVGFGVPNSYFEYQRSIGGLVSVQYGSASKASVVGRELRPPLAIVVSITAVVVVSI